MQSSVIKKKKKSASQKGPFKIKIYKE